MNKTTKVLVFGLGAAVGFMLFVKILSEHKQKSQPEELDIETGSISSTEINESLADEEVKSKAAFAKEKPSVIDYYSDKLKKEGYINYSEYSTPAPENKTNETEEKLMKKIKLPYVIPPDEFGEDEDYELITLTYYADRVLTDDSDKVLREYDDMIGEDALNCFGEYEDDSVFVKNDKLKCYYEILLDERDFLEAVKPIKPHQRDD